MAGHGARRRGDDIASGDLSAAGDSSAVEVRHETVEDPEQRRLAASGWPGHYRQPVFDRQAYILQRGLVAPGIPVREVGQRRDRHTSTGVKRSKQAAMGQGWIVGRVSDGYANQSAAQPAARAAAKPASAKTDAATSSQSERRRAWPAIVVRTPEPNPRASIDSASWIEPSTLVSTTGTPTSIHERGPRGRHPRSRCASVTSTKGARPAGPPPAQPLRLGHLDKGGRDGRHEVER